MLMTDHAMTCMHCCIVVICDEARLVASEEEQQRLLQIVEQWKKMFHSREMEISQLQNENERLRVQNKCKLCILYVLLFFTTIYNV